MKGRHGQSRFGRDEYWIPKRDRLNIDEGDDSDATDRLTGADDDDLDRYKPGGDLYSDKVVEEADLA